MKRLNMSLSLILGLLMCAHAHGHGHGHGHGGGGHRCVHSHIMDEQMSLPSRERNARKIAWQDYHSHPGFFSENATDTYSLSSSADIAMRRRRLIEGAQAYEGSSSSSERFSPIRIHMHAANMEELNVAKKNFLMQTLMPKAIEWISSALSVRPVKTKLKAVRFCPRFFDDKDDPKSYHGKVCTEIEQEQTCNVSPNPIIPPEWFDTMSTCQTCYSGDTPCSDCTQIPGGGGLANTDFTLFVTAAKTPHCSSTVLAFAGSCQYDQYDRPTMGVVNFCPDVIEVAADTSSTKYQDQYSTAVHEILHALGFSFERIPYFRDPDTLEPLTSREADGTPTVGPMACADGTTKTIELPSSKSIQVGTERGGHVAKIVSAQVAAAVQEHFKCLNLNGAELENQELAQSECYGSHWEERLFMDDLMSPVANHRYNAYSKVTLAFMADSGWYIANYSSTTPSMWGIRAGCKFTEEKCIGLSGEIVNGGDGTFCKTDLEKGCTADYLAKGFCDLKSYAGDLDVKYRYFSDNKLGGSFVSADYCPFFNGYSNGGCKVSSNQPTSNYFGEVYGDESSRCVQSTFRQTVDGLDAVNPPEVACYKVECLADTIKIFGKDVDGNEISATCTFEEKGAEKSMKKPSGGAVGSGIVVCPDFDKICASRTMASCFCSGHGSCNVNNICICQGNYEGKFCNQIKSTALPPSPSPARTKNTLGVGGANKFVVNNCLLAFFTFAYTLALLLH